MKASILRVKKVGFCRWSYWCAAIGATFRSRIAFLDSMESSISSMMFPIPAVKGIEFEQDLTLLL